MHDGIFDFYFCDRCRAYVLDERNGDLQFGITRQTTVQSLPQGWTCPVCGGTAADLRPVTMFDHISQAEIAKALFQIKTPA